MIPINLSDQDALILSPCETGTITTERNTYEPLPIARLITREEVPVVTKWQLDADDLARLKAGAGIYVTILTWGRPIAPMIVTVGVPVFDGEQSQPRA